MFRQPSRVLTLGLVLYLCVYLFLGIRTETRFMSIMPLPDHWMEDFGFYERALDKALTGQGYVYGSRLIGVAFLYPPPSLFVVELFGHIEPLMLKGTVFAAVNVLLMLLLVHGIARLYSLGLAKTWWWYALCLGFAPFLEVIHLGQINVITMFGIFLLYYWESTRPGLAGAGLGLGVATKVSPLLFFGYLFANRRFRAAAYAVLAILLLFAAGILRYGLEPLRQYPEAFRWLLDQQQLDSNSQSLTAKLAVADTPEYQKLIARLPESIRRVVNYPFAAATIHTQTLQRFLSVYVLILMLASFALTFLSRGPREPSFIITALGMMLSPNIMWYHHYVFFLLPLLIWIAWRQFDTQTILWCLLGFLVIQADRFAPPYGLLIHIFGHLTILFVLAGQARDWLNNKRALDWRLHHLTQE